MVLPLIGCIGIAVGLWLVFHPGILTSDSIDQYREARTGRLSNVFPPVMSITLSWLMAIGGDIDVMILLQACAVIAGLWLLARNLLDLRRPDSAEGVKAWCAAAVVVVLLVPVSPLAFYAVTFWKDVWVLGCFLWIGALAIWLFRRSDVAPSKWWSIFVLQLVVMTIAVLARHNAIVVVPAFVAMTAMTLARRRTRFPLLWASAVGAAMLAAPRTVEQLWSVENGRPFLQVVALDLIGMCVLDPTIRSDVPWTDRHLAVGYEQRYEFGQVDPILYKPPLIVDPAYFADADALQDEYRRAVLAHPWLYAQVKWRAFHRLLGFARTELFFAEGIAPNEMNLEQNRTFAGIRTTLASAVYASGSSPWLRWFAGVQGVWLVIALVMLALQWNRRRSQSGAAGLCIALLLYPLLYYASYLAAVPMPAYRFMYPATLTIQVLCLTGFAALLLPWARPARQG